MPIRFLAIALGLSAILSSTPGMAATPKLKGTYVEHDTIDCGASGNTYYAFTAQFTPASGTVHFVGFEGHPGNALSPVDVSLSYSNDRSTVTFGALVYQAIYGPMDAQRVPQFFQMILSSSPCTEQIWFQKKS